MRDRECESYGSEHAAWQVSDGHGQLALISSMKLWYQWELAGLSCTCGFEAVSMEAMNGHVPMGCCVVCLHRRERSTAACRLLGKCLMGATDSPAHLGEPWEAIRARSVYFYLELRSHVGRGAMNGYDST